MVVVEGWDLFGWCCWMAVAMINSGKYCFGSGFVAFLFVLFAGSMVARFLFGGCLRKRFAISLLQVYAGAVSRVSDRTEVYGNSGRFGFCVAG